ncbi:MAG: DegT/DnrJ/EryC1/StrS family aminotransferase [Calditrichia bacterium]
MQVPFVDLKIQYQKLQKEILSELEAVCQNTAFVLGPFVSRFEQAFARYLQVPHCIGVNSGTSAVELALRALIRPGDEVITTPNTFIATSEAVTAAGGVVRFADIRENTQLMDPDKLAQALTPRTRAILPVHLFGQPADMDAIMKIAAGNNLAVVEDAAQAHGARYRSRLQDNQWLYCGSMGQAAAFSFYPGKNLGAYGEAGAVTTSSESVDGFIRKYRDHGSQEKYLHEFEGHNMRMEGFQGAVLHVKLKYLEEWSEARRRNAAYYNQLFAGADGVITPAERENARHVYHLYVIRVKDREGLLKHLQAAGIGCGYHYKLPLHLQKAYHHLPYKKGDFPVTEKVMQEIISLPMYPELSQSQMEYVAEKVIEFVQ